MLIGIGSDLHARPKDNTVKVAAVAQWLEGMRVAGCRWGVFCGDWFDSEQIGDRFTSAKEVLQPYLDLINHYGIPLLVIAGNHDPEACKLLGSSPWVEVVSEPRRVKLESPGEAPLYVLAWPWGRAHDPWGPVEAMRDRLRFEVGWLNYESGGRGIFCGHLGTEGVSCPNGFAYPEDAISCLTREEVLDLEHAVAAVFLGHVHTANRNRYVGPMALSNHGEEDQSTGWILYESQTGREEYVGIRGPQWATLAPEEFDPACWPPDSRLRIRGAVDPAIRAQFPWLTIQQERQQEAVRRFQETLETGDLLKLALQWCRLTGQPTPDPETQEIFQGLGREVVAESGEESFCPIERLTRVRLQNIGRRHRDTAWEFPTGEKTIALCGPIGTGKTLILESLYMALWGAWLTPRRSLENMADPQGVAPSVTVEFEAQGVSYSVSRSPGYLRVLRAGQPVTKTNKVKENEAWLSSRFPKDSIRDILVPQRAGVLIEDGEAALMAYMSKVLRLEVWDKLAVLADKHLHSMKAVEYQVQQIPSWTSQMQGLEQQMSQLEYQLAAARNTLPGLLARREEVRAIMSSSLRLQELDKQISLQTVRLQQAEGEFGALETRRGQMENLNKVVEMVEPARTLLQEAVEVQRAIQQAREEIRILEPVAGRWEQAGCRDNPIPCPLIGTAQEVWRKLQATREREQAQQVRWNQILAEFQPFLQGFALLGARASLDGPERILQILDSSTRDLENGIRSITQDEVKLTEKKLVWQAEMEQLQQQARAISGTRQEALSVQEEQLSLERQITSAQEQIRYQELQVHNYRVAIENFTRQITEANAAQQKRLRYQWIQQACSRTGIRQMLIEDALPGLQKILDDLCGGPMEGRFWLTLQTQKQIGSGEQRESFQILFEQDGVAHDALACSGGQLAQVKGIWAAAMLMWQQRTATHQILLLDEITAGMDAESCEIFMRLLNEQVRAQQILIVTHSAEVADRCKVRLLTHGV